MLKLCYDDSGGGGQWNKFGLLDFKKDKELLGLFFSDRKALKYTIVTNILKLRSNVVLHETL